MTQLPGDFVAMISSGTSTGTSAQRFALWLLCALLVFCHLGLWLHLKVFDVTAESLMLSTALFGILMGPLWGIGVGFSFGLISDLVSTTPFGLGALSLTLTGYIMARSSGFFHLGRWWQSILSGAAGTTLGVLLFVIIGELLGQDYLFNQLFRTIAVNLIFAVLLSPWLWIVLLKLDREAKDNWQQVVR